MKLKYSILFLIGFYTLPLLINAQGQGREMVTIRTNVDDIEVLVEDSLVFTSNQFSLPVGTYYIKLWSPGYKIEEGSIMVTSNGGNNFQFGLKPTDEYVSTYKAIRKFDNHKKINYTLGIGATVVGGVIGGLFHNNMNQVSGEYNSLYGSYRYLNSNVEIQDLKYELSVLKKERRNHQIFMIFGYTIMGLGVGYLTYTIIQYKKSNRPMEYVPPEYSPWHGKFDVGFLDHGIGIKYQFN